MPVQRRKGGGWYQTPLPAPFFAFSLGKEKGGEMGIHYHPAAPITPGRISWVAHPTCSQTIIP